MPGTELADAVARVITLIAGDVIPEAIDEAMGRYVHELRRSDHANWQEKWSESRSEIVDLQRENNALRLAISKFGEAAEEAR